MCVHIHPTPPITLVMHGGHLGRMYGSHNILALSLIIVCAYEMFSKNLLTMCVQEMGFTFDL